MTVLIVTGTDTGIGKTVFAAGLAAALGAHYWKPIQAGVDPMATRKKWLVCPACPPRTSCPKPIG